MIRVKLQGYTSAAHILGVRAKLELKDVDLILRERRLSWFGHVRHSSGAVRTVCDIQVDGRWDPGRPELPWKNFFLCFVALRPKSTAMVIAGRSVHLTTLFPGQA